ncbi:MAG: hypothetical protein R2789_04695 [Microthrixaceae bacterium]
MPDSAVLYPGHLYSPKPSQNMGEVRSSNMVFKPSSAEEWMRVRLVLARWFPDQSSSIAGFVLWGRGGAETVQGQHPHRPQKGAPNRSSHSVWDVSQ